MEATTVKVSGEITDEEHRALSAIALEHKKTVGALVSFAVRRVVKDLRSNPNLIKKLPADRRRFRGD